jgi:transposase
VSWQAGDEHAFDLAAFTIDWDAQVVICPMGKPSRYWGPARGPRGKPFIQVQFRKGDCLARSARSRCTRSQSAPRGLRLLPKEQHRALEAARQRRTTEEFQEKYASRAGIEGTIAQAVDKLDMRRSRYRGLAKTHLQHLMTASALHLRHALDWLANKPRSQTRVSHFTALTA